VLGGPRYQVHVDGQHTREVHVDHLQPGVRTEVQAESVSNPVEDPIGELANNLFVVKQEVKYAASKTSQYRTPRV